MRRITDRSHTIVSKSGTVVFIGLLSAGSLPWTVQAGELAYGLGYLGEYSDNIGRTPTNPRREWINSALAGILYLENGPAIDAHLLAQAEYRNYKHDTYEDGPYYYADASLLWRILPQRLNWTFIDRYSQITRAAGLVDTPNNLVNANVLETGPDLFLRLGQVNTLALGLRYGRASYGAVTSGDGGQDNSRISGSARWLYAANSQTTYSLNYETAKVQYDNDRLVENFLRQDEFVRLERQQARMHFRLDLGATQIKRDRTGEISATLARLDWSQQLTSVSTAGIQLGREYQDAETFLLSTATSPTPVPGSPPPSTSTSEAISDFFYTKRIEAYYNRSDSSFRLNTRVYYRDIDYERASLDRQEAGGLLDVTYDLSSLLAATAYGGYQDTEYLNTPVRSDQETEVGVRFLYRINRALSATLDGRRTWRYSTNASYEFTDNRILFSLVFSSSPRLVLLQR